MKNLLLILYFISGLVWAQTSTMVINNYSNYYLEGRLGANGQCNPLIFAVPLAGQSIFTIPPVTTTSYEKYKSSNVSTVPILEWLVNTGSGSSVVRPYYHPVFDSFGPVSLYSDWSMFWFSTFDSSHIFFEEFKMGVNTNCTGNSVTYQLGSYAEAEWFTITSGSTVFTNLNIY